MPPDNPNWAFMLRSGISEAAEQCQADSGWWRESWRNEGHVVRRALIEYIQTHYSDAAVAVYQASEDMETGRRAITLFAIETYLADDDLWVGHLGPLLETARRVL